MRVLAAIGILFALFVLVAQYDACEKKNGVLVRGLVGLECIKR